MARPTHLLEEWVANGKQRCQRISWQLRGSALGWFGHWRSQRALLWTASSCSSFGWLGHCLPLHATRASSSFSIGSDIAGNALPPQLHRSVLVRTRRVSSLPWQLHRVTSVPTLQGSFTIQRWFGHCRFPHTQPWQLHRSALVRTLRGSFIVQRWFGHCGYRHVHLQQFSRAWRRFLASATALFEGGEV